MRPEIRNSKSERNPKRETRKGSELSFIVGKFGIRTSRFIRISDFGFRI